VKPQQWYFFSTTKTKMKTEILSEDGVSNLLGRHHQIPSQCMVHRLATIRTGPGEKRSKVSSRGDRCCWCERSDFLLINVHQIWKPTRVIFNGLRTGTSPVLVGKSSCLSTINIYKLGKSSCLSTINGAFHGSNIVYYPLLFKKGGPPGSPFKKAMGPWRFSSLEKFTSNHCWIRKSTPYLPGLPEGNWWLYYEYLTTIINTMIIVYSQGGFFWFFEYGFV
jgi:hypothetical protein